MSSLMLKSKTKKIPSGDLSNYFHKLDIYGPQLKADLVIKFTDDKEAIKIAKSFDRLLENPLAKINVKFIKVNE